MNAIGKLRLAAVIAVAGFALLAVEYTGYVRSYRDHETQTTLFIKRYPTLQIEFYDPYATEGDDLPIDRLSPRDRVRFADYCRYRFGVSDSSVAALNACRSKASANS